MNLQYCTLGFNFSRGPHFVPRNLFIFLQKTMVVWKNVYNSALTSSALTSYLYISSQHAQEKLFLLSKGRAPETPQREREREWRRRERVSLARSRVHVNYLDDTTKRGKQGDLLLLYCKKRQETQNNAHSTNQR